MATKRGNSDAGGSSSSGAPPAKKLLTQFEPVKIGSVYSIEEMDMKVLQFQNKKLAERIEQRRRAEEDLRRRIEQLEQRQTTDDAVLCIVNRYWNQLDEDVRVLLQRFDAETADETGQLNESPAVTAFLMLLSQWEKPEIEETLCQRVEFSKRAIGKLLQAYDRLLQRNEKVWEAIKGKSEEEDVKNNLKTEIKQEDSKEGVKKEEEKEDEEPSPIEVKQEPKDSESSDITNDKVKTETDEKLFHLSDFVKEEVERLMKENKRLQNLSTEMHQKHHETMLKNAELTDKLAASETEVAELKNQVEDLEYHLNSATQRVDKLDRHLADTMQKLKTYQEGEIKVQGGGEGVSKNKFNEIVAELEEQKELATNRLTELEKLQTDHQEAVKEIEKLKMDIKTQLEEARSMLSTSKNTHLRQIEHMESDELNCQKKLRTEVIQLEDQLAQVRREYEMLRIEFEQTLAANEQTSPINREMRNLITSLKNHNEQLKGEIARYKRKLRESQIEINKLKSDVNQLHNVGSEPTPDKNTAASTPSSLPATARDNGSNKERREEMTMTIDEDSMDADTVSNNTSATTTNAVSSNARENSLPRDVVVADLKAELKKSQDREKELKLLLDMYKGLPKDHRDKVQLLTSEKKARQEIEELRQQVRRLQENERKERRKLAEEDALKKIKRLEDSNIELSGSLSAQKQEEEALLNEMEVTGQAFEDMQEQNIRLLQQLREKDDANFKLMSERIKSNQIHKLLREEKDVLVDQVAILQSQVEAQNVVVRKLEEKERILQTNIATIEKELGLRHTTLDLHKRKSIETAQTAADLKLHLDKYQAQLKEAQIIVADKTSALQQQNFKYKRIQEELASVRRKLERAKKIEMASSADEVLMEEIREYKEQLTCPSCKVKKKNAVLTKCFHVFCLDCLKTRYETRQRKCPKCNAAFGANDYHRIYLDV
ncbi:hypothetical protein LSH36_1238g00029 [Paralvinella palmiformis]|uniref:E3 ubiquitin protein ligase n=1 Tax=Paralvinella palmiformis TaxID=53620 RepID=A0AAD9IUY9_9ANNE|nr:hypothetical protein LSH36_1238g00029 [Paralvinella palmiformis]